MHSYSTDSNERKWIPLLLLFVSIIFSMFSIYLWDGMRAEGILGQVYFIISIIIDFSVIFYYELFYHLFDNWLWKYSLIPFVKVPNLNGVWEGTLKSSYGKGDNAITNVEATMEINQTWRNIEIRLKTENSDSKTITAAFFTKNQDAIVLRYQYQSEPKQNAEDTMHIHNGTGWFTLSSDGNNFEGGYYNGRDSKNHGSLKFKKI